MHKTGTALLAIMLVSSLSLWGCTHQKNGANNAKIRELELRYTKLEEDYRVIVAANENHRKKLVQLETQRNELAQKVEELEVAVKERDELKKQVAARTQERDSAQAQMMQFSKDLVALAGRIEAAANSATTTPGVVVATPTSNKSD